VRKNKKYTDQLSQSDKAVQQNYLGMSEEDIETKAERVHYRFMARPLTIIVLNAAKAAGEKGVKTSEIKPLTLKPKTCIGRTLKKLSNYAYLRKGVLHRYYVNF
jgi:hypothetical protein